MKSISPNSTRSHHLSTGDSIKNILSSKDAKPNGTNMKEFVLGHDFADAL